MEDPIFFLQYGYHSVHLVFFSFLPESPRWLIANGRKDEAMKILEHVAKVNGKTLPKAADDIYIEKHTFKDILPIMKNRTLVLRWLTIIFMW